MARLKNQTGRPRVYGFRLPPAYNIVQIHRFVNYATLRQ